MSSYGMWLSAAGMKVQEHRQTLLNNNLANVETTGFKHDLAVVTQRPVESMEQPLGMQFAHPMLDGLPGGVNVRPPHHNLAQGRIEHTGRPLDVAIQGEGFFAVTDGRATRYTRDGEFLLNPAGELVMAAGDGRWQVLDEVGTPLVANPDGQPLRISADGTVRQGAVVVGRIGAFTTDNPQSLRKIGENLFDAGDAEMTATEPRLVPEAREASNFEVMHGLASMIEAARAYQMNGTLIQLQDQLTGRVMDVARTA